MSVNDIVTAVLAAAAVVVSVVALVINNVVDRRATRNALTDLALKVSKQVAEYDTFHRDGNKQFRLSLEIQILIRQADYLIDRLGTEFSESVSVTLAQALELIGEFWWADIYWTKGAATKNRYFRATMISYWGLALMTRGELGRGRFLIEEAVEVLSPPSIDDYIVRGDIYRNMAQWDSDKKDFWLTKAQEQYQNLPKWDQRLGMYMRLVTDARMEADTP